MDGDGWQGIIIALVSLAVMASVAYVQTALGHATRAQVRDAVQEAEDRLHLAHELVNSRRSLALALIVVQVLAAVIASAQLVFFFETLTTANLSWVAILIVGLVYLLLGQALPRAMVTKQRGQAITFALSFGGVARVVVRPVTWAIDGLSKLLASMLPGEALESEPETLDSDAAPEEAMLNDFDISEQEREMIEGILKLKDIAVRDVMVPRLDIVAVDWNADAENLVETITEAGHSRIPVYQDSIDRVLGVLYAKDLLPYVPGTTGRIPVLDMLRPAYVVPESKRLHELFAEFRHAHIHFAIVADEYGGTAGLVTIEDVLEEVVGEIQDEYDTEAPLFEQEDEQTLVADGRMSMSDIEDALHVRFEPDDDFGTLSGFIHKHLGRLPRQGDVFEADSVRVEILTIERQRVRKVRLAKPPPVVLEEPETKERVSIFRRDTGEKNEDKGEAQPSRNDSETPS